jgi:hypothetical protein
VEPGEVLHAKLGPGLYQFYTGLGLGSLGEDAAIGRACKLGGWVRRGCSDTARY